MFTTAVNQENIYPEKIQKNVQHLSFNSFEFAERFIGESGNELEEKKEAFIVEAMPYLNILYKYAYKRLGNKLDADDLIQDTYMRAFRFFNTFERGTNCKAWLFRIMKNIFIKNNIEQKKNNNVSYDDIQDFVESIKSLHLDTNDLQQRIFSNLLDDELTNALNSIREEFKFVVILSDLEGLSYEEISDFLNCPVGTVRSRLHRGRKLLQEKLFLYARKRGYNV